MELKSMKMTAADRKEMEPQQSMIERPEYPWGLTINLDEASIDKLGLSILPGAGDEMTLHAVVKVESVSQSEHARGKHRSMSLQITDMAVGPKETKPNASEKLYSKG